MVAALGLAAARGGAGARPAAGTWGGGDRTDAGGRGSGGGDRGGRGDPVPWVPTPAIEQVHLTPGPGPESRLGLGAGSLHVTAQFVVKHLKAQHPLGFCEFGVRGVSDGFGRSEQQARAGTYTSDGFVGTIYTSTFTGLSYDAFYEYYCGVIDERSGAILSKSQVFTFLTPSNGTGQTRKTFDVLTWGDMGAPGQGTKLTGMDSQVTIDAMQSDVRRQYFQLAINVGDSSYADDFTPYRNCWVEDKWYNAMEGIMSEVPTAVVVGNHEAQYNFAPHLHRTAMPASGSGRLKRFYSSQDYGPLRVVAFSSEHDYSEGSEQHEFVANALRDIDRLKTPFVIVFAHRPMYCSSGLFSLPGDFFHRCTVEAPRIRKPFEEIFKEAGVDLYLSGHNHQFERSHPMYKGRAVTEGEVEGDAVVYRNPGAPIYIVNGAAGNKEGNDPTWLPHRLVKWRAAHSKHFHMGYGRIRVDTSGETPQLSWEYVDASTGRVTDKAVLIRDV